MDDLVKIAADESRDPPKILSMVPSPGELVVRTSLPCSTPEDRAAIFSARSGEQARCETVLGQPFRLTGWLVCPSQRTDEESGEEHEYLVQILIRADGPPIRCASDGVLRSLRDLTQVFGPAPWDLPWPIKICQRRTRKGRLENYLDFAE